MNKLNHVFFLYFTLFLPVWMFNNKDCGAMNCSLSFDHGWTDMCSLISKSASALAHFDSLNLKTGEAHFTTTVHNLSLW